MAILRYEGKFGRDGRVINTTAVVYECDGCRRVFRTVHAAYRNLKHGGLCRVCARTGSPKTEAEVIARYPQIEQVLTFGTAGGVTTESRVRVRCSACDRVVEKDFRTACRRPGHWTCKMCARAANSSWKSPEINALPGWVLDYERDTLSQTGRVTQATLLWVECRMCKAIRTATWATVKKSTGLCRRCNIVAGWEDPVKHIARSNLLKALWQTDEFRRNVLENRHNGGYMSGLHRRVKAAMEAAGLTDFESEQVIGNVRVDEVDREQHVVLEIYGDFWHFNPAVYVPDHCTTRSGKPVTARSVWALDKHRINYLTECGYSVYVIWEKDFNEDPDRSVADFKAWIETAVPEMAMAVKE